MTDRKAIFTRAVPERAPAPPASSTKQVQLTERATPPLAWIRELAATNADMLMDLYVQGWSFRGMAEMLETKFPDLSISPSRLRNAVLESQRGRELYAAAMVDRSHMLVEAALDAADKAAKTGDSGGFRTAADIRLKVAAKLNPKEYGEKSSVMLHGTGKDGAIKTEHSEAMSDAALEAVVAQAMKGGQAATKH